MFGLETSTRAMYVNKHECKDTLGGFDLDIMRPRGAIVTTSTRLCSIADIPPSISTEEEVFSGGGAEPLPAACPPTAQSPDYVPESDHKEDPEEDDDEDPLMIILCGWREDESGHQGDDDMIWTSRPMMTMRRRSTQLLPTLISILAQVPTPVWSDAEVARLLAISTPSSSPLSQWSSPLPQIPYYHHYPHTISILPESPPLPIIITVPDYLHQPPASPIRSLGYRAAMIRLRAEAASTSHSLPLPPPFILSHTRPAAPSSGTPP
ncbi:hypothetical protein Tco_1439557 [Tanacetum coccineum]